MSNLVKSLIFLFIFIFLVVVGTVSVAAQKTLGNMPTTETCNCLVVNAVSSSNGSTFKTGTVTIYKNGVVFNFGSSTVTLKEFKEDVFIDADKGDIWLAVTDTAGDRVFRLKKKYMYYSTK